MIYQPRDQSDIYLRALDARLRQMQNPYAGIPQAVNQFSQNLTAIGARKNLTDYLSLPEDQKALPENKQKFYQSALLMGVDPSKFIAQKVDPLTLEKQKEAGRIEAIDEAAKKRDEFAKNHPRVNISYQLTPEQNENMKWGMNNGLIAPKQMSARGPKSSIMADMLGDMRSGKSPKKSLMDMDIGMAATQAGSTTSARNVASIRTNLESAHGGFIKSMELAKSLAGKFDIGMINQIINSGGRGLNDPDAIQLYAHLYAAANNFARMAKGGAASLGEQDTKDALKIISARLNAGGIAAVEKAAEAEYQGRLQGAQESLGQSGTGSSGGWSYVGPAQ